MPGQTYSFLDVVGTITGPGGSFPLASGAAPAEEGITIEMLEDKDDMKVGADGAVMHSLRASRAARITVRLLKTSPVNSQLSIMYNLQAQSSGLWGQNVIVISDIARGDQIASALLAFARQPTVVYAKDGNMNEWQFLGNVVQLLGTGNTVAG